MNCFIPHKGIRRTLHSNKTYEITCFDSEVPAISIELLYRIRVVYSITMYKYFYSLATPEQTPMCVKEIGVHSEVAKTKKNKAQKK